MRLHESRDAASPEQRRQDVADLLALGLLRLAQHRQRVPENSSETCLELSAELSVNGPSGERDSRAANAADRSQKSEPTKCANTSPALTTTTLCR